MAKANKKKRTIIPMKWCICTEGETEAIYLRSYCEALGIKHLVDINSENPSCPLRSGKACGRQHRSLIDQVQICNKSSNYEKMIAVHDFDEDGNVKTQSFDDAFAAGKEAGISVYYSIPSFEYWLLPHNNPIDANLSRVDCSSRVKEYINKKRKDEGKPRLHKEKYKTDDNLFLYFGGLDGADRAEQNAKKRWINGKMPEKPSSVKPSTNLYDLLDKLKRFAERQK